MIRLGETRARCRVTDSVLIVASSTGSGYEELRRITTTTARAARRGTNELYSVISGPGESKLTTHSAE